MSIRWLPDVNIWLALSLPEHVHHRAVQAWLGMDEHPLFFCRASQQSFLRLLTTAAVIAPYKLPPLSNRQAQLRMRALLESDRIHLASEPPHIEGDWERFADSPFASPKLWMDAYLAAFAIAGGYRLVTTDRAFKQFKGVNLLVL